MKRLIENIVRLQELMGVQSIKQLSVDDEIEEIERTVEYLHDDEGLNITPQEIVKSLKRSPEFVISDEIWNKLENTESNEIEVGDWESVANIVNKYDKTDPEILANALKSGKYSLPLVLKFNERYYLIAGNTRLCVAAAMGMKPKILLANLDE